jgi:replicative DNA helicase
MPSSTNKEKLRQLEQPAVHLSEIPISDLVVKTMDCGFPSLNELMLFRKGRQNFIIVGATPGTGKSAFIMQIAAYVAKTAPVLVFSLEMDKEAIKARLMAAQSGRNIKQITRGTLSPDILRKADYELSALKYYIDDRPLNIDELVSAAMLMSEKQKFGLIVVDYLQHITAGKVVSERIHGNRAAEVGDISFKLRKLSKSLKIPVLCAAQVNRQVSNRARETGNYRPRLSDLKESGNIEQDADAVIMISRPEINDGTRQGEADIEVVKNRSGELKLLNFQFLGASTRFLDRKESEDL